MAEKRGMKALELWCRRVTEGYPGVKIENMTTSWRDGLAFCALIHHFRPDLIDFDRLDKRDIYKNNELAFRIAERQLGIPALLDAEDMVEYEVPDRLSILTYLSQFYQAFVSNQQGSTAPSQRTHPTKVPEIITPTAKTQKAPKVGAGRLESCWSCRRPVFLAERLVAGGKLRHRTCFTCQRCGHQLNPVGYYETEQGEFVCETCPDEERRSDVQLTKDTATEGAVDDTAPDSKDEYSLDFESALESMTQSRRKDDSKSRFLQELVGSSDQRTESPETITNSEFSAMEVSFVEEHPAKMGFEGDRKSNSSMEKLTFRIKNLLGSDVPVNDTLSLLKKESDSFLGDISEIIDNIINDAVKKAEHRNGKRSSNKLGFPYGEKTEDVEEVVEKEVAEVGGEETAEAGDEETIGAGDEETAEAGDEEDEDATEPADEDEDEEEEIAQVRGGEEEELGGKELAHLGEGEILRDLKLAGKVESEDSKKSLQEDESVEIRVVDMTIGSAFDMDEVASQKAFHKGDDLKGRKFTRRSIDANYPEELNPFAEDDEEFKVIKPPVTPRRHRVLPIRPRSARYNQSGQKIVEAPKVNLNPFWSDGEEPSSEDELSKPVPAPRASLRCSDQDSPFSRSRQGSFTSLSSIGSSASALRRRKGPAPQPPHATRSPRAPSGPESRYPSPTPMNRGHRKSRPAPPPPPNTLHSDDSELITEKQEKNYENKVKQNLSTPDKSSYGKWKRKKGQAPGLPIPQRRRITPLPLPEVYRELEDLEIQQRELERQGVSIEQTIRQHEAEVLETGAGNEEEGKDVEELVIQLFEIVNQKNELFRRQAELMLLRRQQRLEEEHADIEYQIRCLMGRPERNKTDSDKAQEEELIRRLVDVVERRNEIIECLDMDRKREVEEDKSIHHHLEAFAGKKTLSEKSSKNSAKGSPNLLKYIKKKKSKKEKGKEVPVKTSRDMDKDIDETGKEEGVKTPKTKKKWFPKS